MTRYADKPWNAYNMELKRQDRCHQDSRLSHLLGLQCSLECRHTAFGSSLHASLSAVLTAVPPDPAGWYWDGVFPNVLNDKEFWGSCGLKGDLNMQCPRNIHERDNYGQKVLVRAAISSHRIIGAFFFDETVNSEQYLGMLRNQFFAALWATRLPMHTQWLW